MELIEKIKAIQSQIENLEELIDGINDALGLRYYDVRLSGYVMVI